MPAMIVHRNLHCTPESVDLRSSADAFFDRDANEYEFSAEVSFVDRKTGVILDFTNMTKEDAITLSELITKYPVKLSHFDP